MRKFIFRVLIFVIPFILLAYISDKTISGILKKSNSFADGEYPVWNDLYNGEINSDIVIYGSSRALKHISPEILYDSLNVPAYNLGVNGHTLRSEYFRHTLLMKYNRLPRLIIQTIDVTSFEKISDLYNPDQFLPYMLNNTEMERGIFNGFRHIDYHLPMIRYFGKKEAMLEVLKLVFAERLNTPVRVRGYRPRDQEWTDDLKSAKQKMGLLEVKSDSAIIVLFEKFIAECKEKKLPLVLVYTPEYIEGQKFVSNRADILSIYSILSQKYDVPLLDYSNDSISYNRNYFYNSGHLNKTGAELFTRMLIRDLYSINLLPLKDEGQ